MNVNARKPLIVVTVYNRRETTRRMLASLSEMTGLDDAVVAIMDNGSTDGAGDVIDEWHGRDENESAVIYHLPENVGTSRAINRAIADLRQPGQALVKLDNDVTLLNPGWIGGVQGLLYHVRRNYNSPRRKFPSPNYPVALVRAYRIWRGKELPNEDPRYAGLYAGHRIFLAERDLGYSVWYTGEFMDAAGHFEVLSPEHLYGFDDVIMGHKARQLGMLRLIWAGWRIGDIQRSSAIKGKDAHVERLRPLLHARLAEIHGGGSIYAGTDGIPI
jgi:hypothetical protein